MIHKVGFDNAHTTNVGNGKSSPGSSPNAGDVDAPSIVAKNARKVHGSITDIGASRLPHSNCIFTTCFFLSYIRISFQLFLLAWGFFHYPFAWLPTISYFIAVMDLLCISYVDFNIAASEALNYACGSFYHYPIIYCSLIVYKLLCSLTWPPLAVRVVRSCPHIVLHCSDYRMVILWNHTGDLWSFPFFSISLWHKNKRTHEELPEIGN